MSLNKVTNLKVSSVQSYHNFVQPGSKEMRIVVLKVFHPSCKLTIIILLL